MFFMYFVCRKVYYEAYEHLYRPFFSLCLMRVDTPSSNLSLFDSFGKQLLIIGRISLTPYNFEKNLGKLR